MTGKVIESLMFELERKDIAIAAIRKALDGRGDPNRVIRQIRDTLADLAEIDFQNVTEPELSPVVFAMQGAPVDLCHERGKSNDPSIG